MFNESIVNNYKMSVRRANNHFFEFVVGVLSQVKNYDCSTIRIQRFNR
jgi:hypothetical protein